MPTVVAHQLQNAPAQQTQSLQTGIRTKPDHGEESYVGKGLLPGDIRSREHCRELVANTVGAFGRLDVRVNNATAPMTNENLDDIA